MNLADEDPNDADHILDVYKNASYEKFGGGNTFYNRENPWPSSYGLPISLPIRLRLRGRSLRGSPSTFLEMVEGAYQLSNNANVA